MKKILVAIFALTFLALPLVACNGHRHEYLEWSYDESYHWKECKCGSVVRGGDHEFEYGVCEECGFRQGEAVHMNGHTHTYEDKWSYDETTHYRTATCNHTDCKTDVTKHTFVKNVCSVCGYEYFTPDLTYALIDTGDGYKVTGALNTSTIKLLVVPSEYNGLPVKEVDGFSVCDSLVEVFFPDTVTTIGTYAFYNCANLKKIYLPASINAIGYNAFGNCPGEKEIHIDDISDFLEIYYLNYYPFLSYRLFEGEKEVTELEIPQSDMTYIRDYCFYGCSSLKSVKLPDSITYIGESAFSDCSSLTEVQFGSRLGIIGKRAFASCTNLTYVTIPDCVEKIEEEAFLSCERLYGVKLGKGIKQLGKHAFYYCPIIELYNVSGCDITTAISESVTKIFTDENTPSRFVEVDGFLVYFNDDNSLPILLMSFGSNADLVLPKDLGGRKYMIYGNAFNSDERIVSLTISQGVEVIGGNAFNGCVNLRDVKIEKGVMAIMFDAFKGCENIRNVSYSGTVADWIKILPENNFSNPTYYSGDLYIDGKPVDKVDTTGTEVCYEYSFINCQSIKKVNVGADTRYFEPQVFYNCGYIESLTVSEGNKYFEAKDNCIITKAGNASVAAGKLVMGCSASIIPDGLKSIGSEAFAGARNLKMLVIPDSIYGVGEGAFRNSGLETIVFVGKARVALDDYTFADCANLKQVILPTSLETIGDWQFSGCASLENIVIPSSVTEIGRQAFSGCTKLDNVNLPQGLSIIGEYAFKNCSSIKKITIPDSVEIIKDSTFRNCGSLGEVVFGKSVKTIGQHAFEGCGFEKIVLPEGLEEIHGDAFFGCSNLKEVTIPMSVKAIGGDAFEGTDLSTVYYNGTRKEFLDLLVDKNNLSRLYTAKMLPYSND